MAVEAAELKRSVDDVTDLLMGMMDSLLEEHQPSLSPQETPRELPSEASLAKDQEVAQLLRTLQETMMLDCQTFSDTVNHICDPRLGPGRSADAAARGSRSSLSLGPRHQQLAGDTTDTDTDTAAAGRRSLESHPGAAAPTVSSRWSLERSLSLPAASR
jgi:hypothetical protein